MSMARKCHKNKPQSNPPHHEEETHARIQKVLSKGVQLWQRCFLLVCFISWWGEGGSKYHYKLSGSSSAHQRNAMMAHHWMLAWKLCDFQGSRTSIAKKPYILWFFGGGWPPVPPLDPRMAPWGRDTNQQPQKLNFCQTKLQIIQTQTSPLESSL